MSSSSVQSKAEERGAHNATVTASDDPHLAVQCPGGRYSGLRHDGAVASDIGDEGEHDDVVRRNEWWSVIIQDEVEARTVKAGNSD